MQNYNVFCYAISCCLSPGKGRKMGAAILDVTHSRKVIQNVMLRLKYDEIFKQYVFSSAIFLKMNQYTTYHAPI